MQIPAKFLVLCICSLFIPAHPVLGDDLLGGVLGGDASGDLLGGILGGLIAEILALLKKVICLVQSLIDEVQEALNAVICQVVVLINQALQEQCETQENCQLQQKDVQACVDQENICLKNANDTTCIDRCKPPSLDKTKEALAKLKAIQAEIQKDCTGLLPPPKCCTLRQQAIDQQKVVDQLTAQLKTEQAASKICLDAALKRKEAEIQKCKDCFKACVEETGCVIIVG